MAGVVAGEGAGEQGFGVGGMSEFDEASGGHDVDFGAVEPVHSFGFDGPGVALCVGVVDSVQGAAGGVRVAGAGGGPGQAFGQQCRTSGVACGAPVMADRASRSASSRLPMLAIW